MPNKRDKSKVQVGAFVPREIRNLANKIAKKYGISMSDEILKAYINVINMDKSHENKPNSKNQK